MKSCRTFFRSLRDAFKSVVRNFSLSLASVTCITITLIIIAAALLISENVRNFTDEIEKDVTIVAFLDSDVSDEARKDFELTLKKNMNIETFEFKSKADVKEDMQKENETFSSVLKEWDDEENPLKDTYTIKVHDVNKIGDTAKEIEGIEGVNSVQYGEGLVEKLVGVFDAIEKITIVAAGALIIVTVFLIINTIKLTIFGILDVRLPTLYPSSDTGHSLLLGGGPDIYSHQPVCRRETGTNHQIAFVQYHGIRYGRTPYQGITQCNIGLYGRK